MTLKLQHEWTPEHIATAVELWRRLLDVHTVNAYEQVPCGGSHYRRHVTSKDVTDEWITALVISDGAGAEFPLDPYGYVGRYAPVELSLISYSDYGGSDLDAANVRALADVPGVTTSTGGIQGEGSATMMLGEMPREDDVKESVARIRYVVEVMEGLQEYPLIDEETHSEYIDELAEEAWDQWLSRDVRDEVLDRLGVLLQSDEAADEAYDAAGIDAVREAFYDYAPPNGETWLAEGATSVRHVHHDEAVTHVLVRVFGRDDLDNDCESCQYGTHD